MTSLEKRLISLMDCGITIQHTNGDAEDGHRYIVGIEENELFTSLKENNIVFSTKIYGSLLDALNYIDFLRKKCDCCTLEERFDQLVKSHQDDYSIMPRYDKMHLLVQHEDEVDWEAMISSSPQ